MYIRKKRNRNNVNVLMCDYISLMNNRKLIVFKVNDLNIRVIQKEKFM